MSDAEKLREAVAEAVLEDLCGRKGVGDELDAVRDSDEETWGEIREAIGTLAIRAIRAAGWHLMPAEATDEMVAAMEAVPGDDDIVSTAQRLYAAARAAAPDVGG